MGLADIDSLVDKTAGEDGCIKLYSVRSGLFLASGLATSAIARGQTSKETVTAKSKPMHARANATIRVAQATTSAGAGLSFIAKKRFDMFCSL